MDFSILQILCDLVERPADVYSMKMASLEISVMYVMSLDARCQYLINIAKVTMGDLRNRGGL